MTILRSTLDSAAPEYTAAAEAMTTKLTEIEAEFAKAVAGGGPEKLARHRKRGKLTARERI
ncbi:acyl-CoA carboxylase subunit beta, partial [Nocardia cyriacigeorgica]|nr:acyl-CoA carboxylase subunit beta [Nocardia cyriacigeorgica]